ncbi:hypothetical protein SPRG_13791 [Saprolegnia parasitica CBS 223.65]|uniref:Uncharacterized protein n=1 Tax=Saprolegnia parasitica (strain CBS 223.65) TaxID=695850 RepID=A0A067BRE9_SAPPC|nr:hypothetical protein SPRG_13791 [Saprolegnia parasitica CBS 223.65]KDO21084.1 hypothetical protein SPRG_13791 [Saprolegnia parasitica CBS 223.65]|eukprot:XP_012208180.1 hypothetical protein SPRG_13791 [Saprolegnia parasitica CBS 223.65]
MQDDDRHEQSRVGFFYPTNSSGSTSKLQIRSRPKPAPSSNQVARAQHVLAQATTFFETANSEIYAVDVAMRNVRAAMDSFQLVMEKQLYLCNDYDGFRVSRLKADMIDTLDNIKSASTSMEQTSLRLQKSVGVGRKYILSHTAALGRPKKGATETLSVLDLTPTNTVASLYDVLFPPQVVPIVPPENLAFVLDKLAFRGKAVLEKKELLLFYRELCNWSLANNGVISALDRAHQKKHTTRYATILTAASWEAFEARDGEVHELSHVPRTEIEAFVTSSAFPTLVKSVSEKLGTPSPLKSASKETTSSGQLSAAEQTLSMAKMLHDLATAESEAKAGYRLSVRSNAARSKEFSKAFLSASKELMEKETAFF